MIVKVSVLDKIDDMEVFKRVKALIDRNPDSKYSFEETLKAFRAVGYDEVKAALGILNDADGKPYTASKSAGPPLRGYAAAPLRLASPASPDDRRAADARERRV